MTTSATPLTAAASVRARRSTGTRIGLRRLSLVGGLLLCAAAGSPAEAGAQDERPTKPLIVYLDRDHTRFLKFGALVQIWARHTQMNPGSKLSEGGLVQNAATDVSVRRFRVSMDAQLSERTMGFFQLGVNNLNYISGRGAAVELLDAYASVRRCCSSAGNWCAAPTARADWESALPHDQTFGRPTTREFADSQRLVETPNDLDADPNLSFTTLGLFHWCMSGGPARVGAGACSIDAALAPTGRRRHFRLGLDDR